MKKILVAQELHKMLQQQNSFLNRTGIWVFPAASNEDLLSIHQREMVDLIITSVDLPGMPPDQFAAKLEKDRAVRPARLIVVSGQARSSIEQASRFRPDAVILRPVNPLVLLARAQQLLQIAWRETYRALVNVRIEGSAGSDTFFCRSHDISATGMMIETENAISGRIVCSFPISDSTRIQATAEIVRSLERQAGLYRYGVKFVNMTDDDRKALELFINSETERACSRAS